MKKHNATIRLSASDLSNFLSCRHISELDKKVLNGQLNKPEFSNPHADVLRERGHEHEKNYLDYLRQEGLEILEIPDDTPPEKAQTMTLEAMKMELTSSPKLFLPEIHGLVGWTSYKS